MKGLGVNEWFQLKKRNRPAIGKVRLVTKFCLEGSEEYNFLQSFMKLQDKQTAEATISKIGKKRVRDESPDGLTD